MKASKELFVGVVIAMIAILVFIRHFILVGEERNDAAAAAAAVLISFDEDKSSAEKRISREQAAALFRKNANAEYIVIDIYPVKNSDKEETDLELVFRSPEGKLLEKPLAEDKFREQANNYLNDLRKKNNKLPVPYGYQILATEKHFGKNNALVLDLDPSALKITYAYDSCRFPPGCFPGTNESAGKETKYAYSLALAIFDEPMRSDSCRYPPGCPIALEYTSTMKALLGGKDKVISRKK